MTELSFIGKDAVRALRHDGPPPALVPHPEKGVGPAALDGNLVIEGDNLLALRALAPRIGGAVDCVFIDPPYNTGATGWRYDDSMNAPGLRAWFESVAPGLADAPRSDRWCAMMWPRLALMREIMAPHATLWMTLDHNELANALAILREIFGAESVLGVVATEANPRGRQADAFFAVANDFLLCVAKDRRKARFQGVRAEAAYAAQFRHRDPDGRAWRELGLRQRGHASSRAERERLFYPIHVNPETGGVALAPDDSHSLTVLPKKPGGADGRWNWSPAFLAREIHRVYARPVKGADGAPRWDVFYKDYLERDGAERRRKPRTIWGAEICNTESGSTLLRRMMGADFPYPKPLALIERVLEIAAGPDALVLDAFAGSGATGHAVLRANAREGLARRFILIEMEDFADNLTAERLRRAIRGYNESENAAGGGRVAGLGGRFAYCTLQA